MSLRDLDEVIGDYAGLSRQVLEYSQLMKHMVDTAKRPGFSVESWEPLAELVAVGEFERVGNFKEVMNWPEYVEFLTSFATSTDWECSFKRITESDRVVFLELEERIRVGDFNSTVNSLSVYEFDDSDKIRHLDIYLQMPLPKSGMLDTYEGIQISE